MNPRAASIDDSGIVSSPWRPVVFTHEVTIAALGRVVVGRAEMDGERYWMWVQQVSFDYFRDDPSHGRAIAFAEAFIARRMRDRIEAAIYRRVLPLLSVGVSARGSS